MELQILFVLVTSFIANINSHPKTSDIIPKDYYKRQILQPIPGYIPVYIKADGEPLVRRETNKPAVNANSQKAPEFKESNLSKQTDKISLKNEEEKSGKKTESEIKNDKNTSYEVQEKPELTKGRLKEDENAGQVGKKILKLNF